MSAKLALYCPNCSKKYIRESSYEKHKLLCYNITNKSYIKNETIIDVSENVTIASCKSPSLLMQTLEELVKSNNILKTEIAQLKKESQTKKQKIPIIDILNKNYKSTEDYIDYFDITVYRRDLENIFTYDLVFGIEKIIENKIDLTNENCPIVAFNQKENKIYGYTDKDKWSIISKEAFNNIVSKIIKNIMNEFKKWQDENNDKLYTEDFSMIYLKNVKKVMGGNISQDKLSKKIYNNIFKLLKKPLSSIEYEII